MLECANAGNVPLCSNRVLHVLDSYPFSLRAARLKTNIAESLHVGHGDAMFDNTFSAMDPNQLRRSSREGINVRCLVIQFVCDDGNEHDNVVFF